MKIVYYSHASRPELYSKDFLTYREPDSLYKDLIKDKNEDNAYNNYMDCPAVIRSFQNTFIVRLPWNTTRNIDFNTGKFLNENNQEDNISEYFVPKPTSRSRLMFNLYHHHLLFSEDDLEATVLPAYMHSSELQTKCTYIPGTMNISKWFRPIEGAFELQNGVSSISLKTDDPLCYIKFDTSEPIKFVRFNLSKELWELSQGCVQHKQHQPKKSLLYLYKLFHHTGMRKLILKNIKNNLIE